MKPKKPSIAGRLKTSKRNGTTRAGAHRTPDFGSALSAARWLRASSSDQHDVVLIDTVQGFSLQSNRPPNLRLELSQRP